MRLLRPPILALVIVACSSGDSAPPAAQVVDSAGVKVVVNPPPDTAGPFFRLSPDPIATIGGAGAEGPEYQLFRVGHGTVLGSGNIVVSNAGTDELRFYDPSGRYVRSAGGKGDGPGEFAAPSLVGAFAGDSLMVADVRLKRYSVFDSAGAFVRSFPAPAELGFGYPTVGLLRDGSVMALPRGVPDAPPTPQVVRDPKRVLRVAPDGASTSAFGAFPGAEVSMAGRSGFPVIFGRDLHVAARGDRVAVGNDDSYSIRIYDGSGALLHVVRQTREPARVQPGDFDRVFPEGLRPDAPPSAMKTAMAPALEHMPHVTTFPAYGDLLLDRSGRLWVPEYDPTGFNAKSSSYQAFDDDGVFLGRLDLPDGATILDAGPDWLLARSQDDLDVERVVLYRLVRPAGA